MKQWAGREQKKNSARHCTKSLNMQAKEPKEMQHNARQLCTAVAENENCKIQRAVLKLTLWRLPIMPECKG